MCKRAAASDLSKLPRVVEPSRIKKDNGFSVAYAREIG